MSGFGMGRNPAFGLSNSFSSSIFNGMGKQPLHYTEHTQKFDCFLVHADLEANGMIHL